MNFSGLTTVSQGTVGLGAAIYYFVANGYQVSVPLNDNQDYDLVVDNANGLLKVQVKTASRKSKSGFYVVELKSVRHNKTSNTIKAFDNTKVDLVFIGTESKEFYLIPADEVNVKSALTLNSKYQKYKIACVV